MARNRRGRDRAALGRVRPTGPARGTLGRVSGLGEQPCATLPSTLFEPALFEDLIRDRGQTVRCRMVELCSCFQQATDHPDPDCIHCGGSGQIVGEGVDVPVLVTAVSPRRDATRFGDLQVGDLVLTIPARRRACVVPQTWESLELFARIGENDRFVMLDLEDRYEDVLTRGTETIDPLRHGADTTDIIHVFQAGQVYLKDADYKLYGGGVNWLESAPAAGTRYSVVYTYHPTYRVWQIAQPRVIEGQLLPKKVLIRKLDRVEAP